jgi:diketogulonate reductase-like aldo/keto reductase
MDLYLLHWPSAVPLEDTVEAFRHAHGRRQVSQLGRKFDIADMEELIAVSVGGQH